MTLPFILLVAFSCGFIASRVNLPPLVGYLAAGFVLKAMGAESTDLLVDIADTGILILLFSIGLKLKIKDLARTEIWGTGTLHMTLTTAALGILFLVAGLAGVGPFGGFTFIQALLLGFALSFSSTVFAVKTFEARGDMASLGAVIAIGVLIIQDIAAVVFLTFSSGKFPSPYALLVIPGIVLLRPLFLYLLNQCGHKELLLLLGLVLAIGVGGAGFDLVKLKPDLGALFLGVLLANSSKAAELSETLMGLKDLLLVGFFLTIGLSGLPSLSTLFTACFFIILMPLKSVLFFYLFTRFRLRARTSLLATLGLTNYSEFGLIVMMTGVQAGLIGNEWLLAMALALSVSFLVSSPLNDQAYSMYKRYNRRLRGYQHPERLDIESPINIGEANVIIFGMGRIGTTAYDTFCSTDTCRVLGIDFSNSKVSQHKESGRNVIRGDATDSDFLDRICTKKIELAMLTMESHQANLTALKQLTSAGFKGDISAIARFDDEQDELIKHGASCAYNLYQQAGQGYGDELQKRYSAISAVKPLE